MAVGACNPTYHQGGDYGNRSKIIAWTLEVEVLVSWDSAITLQHEDKRRLCLEKKKKRKEMKNKTLQNWCCKHSKDHNWLLQETPCL